MSAMLGAIRRAAALRAATALPLGGRMDGVSGAIRRASAPRAAVGRRSFSSSTPPSTRPSTSTSDYELLLEKAVELKKEQETLRKLHDSHLGLIEESQKSARDAVREIGNTTLLLELGVLLIAGTVVYKFVPESPSPTMVTADSAKTTAEAAKVTADSAKTTAEAANATAEAAKATAEAANGTAEAAKTAAEAAKTAAEAAKAVVEAKTPGEPKPA